MDLRIEEDPQSPNYGDLVFVNGGLPVVSRKKEDLAQRLTIRLRTFLGEWFLDEGIGVPYYQSVFGKQRNKTAVDLILQSEILKEEDVIEISFFNSEVDKVKRTYSLIFRVRTDTEETDDITIFNQL